MERQNPKDRDDLLSHDPVVNDNLPEQIIEAFENAWRSDGPPDIAKFVDLVLNSKPTQKKSLFNELLLVDMENRWCCVAAGKIIDDNLGGTPGYMDYLSCFPQFGYLENLQPILAAEEYRVRQLWGDQPTIDQFLSRFGDSLNSLLPRLLQVDRELSADGFVVHGSVESRDTTRIKQDPRVVLQFSDYRLMRHLGTGGMGKVYLAVRKKDHCEVAVKSLLKSRQADPFAVDRFLQETLVLANLNHPAIVAFHGLGRFPGGGYFFAMDYIEGQDLSRKIKLESLPVKQTVEICVMVAQAVHFAHQKGIIHCDLKPSNVLQDKTGQVFVMDFGLAKLFAESPQESEAFSSLGGTPGFMAPEQIDSALGPVSPASDIYGIGGILFRLLTAITPSDCRDEKKIAWPSQDKRTPPPLRGICLQCLAWDQLERFTTAGEVASALQGWLRNH